MNASVTRWHIESARISLQTAANLGDCTAAHALKVLRADWPHPGRPAIDDSEALESIARINSRDAVAIVTKAIASPSQRATTAHRLRRKRRQTDNLG